MSRYTFIKNAKSKIGCGYAWAGHGQTLTKDLLERWINQYGQERYYFSGYSVEKWLGKQVYDCSGFVIEMADLGVDMNARMIYDRLCIPCSYEELLDGDLVFRSNFGHVGVYYNNGVIHAKNTLQGVVYETDPLGLKFDAFAKLRKYAHWAFEDYKFMEAHGVYLNNKDLDRTPTMGELITILARYERSRK
jgi:cell wall-associated NlpC family hydrolase